VKSPRNSTVSADPVERETPDGSAAFPGKYPSQANSWRARIQTSLLPPVLFLLGLALLWELMASAMHTTLIPNLGDIALEIRRIVINEDALVHIGLTLERVLLGSALAFLLSLAIGIPAGRNRWLEAFFRPGIVLGLTIPSLVWALLCVIWFGVNWKSPVVALALGITPALTVNTIQGVRAVDYSLVEMAYVFRFPATARLRHLWLPAMAPFLLSGLRTGLSLAWKVIVLVEIFGMSSGVGYELNQEFSSQNVAGVLAWTVIFGGVMGVIEYGLIQGLERRITRWRRTAVV
jgi:NitT/TauT family transport system permease protein